MNDAKNTPEVIAALAVGDSAEFPLEQYDYVVNVRYRETLKPSGKDKKLISKINRARGVVSITRVA